MSKVNKSILRQAWVRERANDVLCYSKIRNAVIHLKGNLFRRITAFAYYNPIENNNNTGIVLKKYFKLLFKLRVV